MPVEHILILTICGLGVFHGISLGGYLMLAKAQRPLPNKLIGTLLIVFGLRISKSIFLYFTEDLDMLLVLLGLNLILLFGPLFYLYVKNYLNKDFNLQKQHALHALPFLVFLVLNLLGIMGQEPYLNIGIVFIYFQFIIYVIASYFRHRQYWSQGNENKHSLARQWMNYLHLGILVVWLSYFMFLLNGLVPYIAGPITYSLVIYPLSLWAILKKIHQPEGKRYQNSRLEHEESKQVIAQLEMYMQQEKAYLNPDLKLPMVAVALNKGAHVISQAVNENFEQNFQQYINGYRIKAAKEMLHADQFSHYTISAIAFDCGFNSLSAFNAAFKKGVEKTPSQYRKERN